MTDKALATLPSNVIDTLTNLVDQSLLRPETGKDDTPRFTMLVIIREYAAQQSTIQGTNVSVPLILINTAALHIPHFTHVLLSSR